MKNKDIKELLSTLNNKDDAKARRGLAIEEEVIYLDEKYKNLPSREYDHIHRNLAIALLFKEYLGISDEDRSRYIEVIKNCIDKFEILGKEYE